MKGPNFSPSILPLINFSNVSSVKFLFTQCGFIEGLRCMKFNERSLSSLIGRLGGSVS